MSSVVASSSTSHNDINTRLAPAEVSADRSPMTPCPVASTPRPVLHADRTTNSAPEKFIPSNSSALRYPLVLLGEMSLIPAKARPELIMGLREGGADWGSVDADWSTMATNPLDEALACSLEKNRPCVAKCIHPLFSRPDTTFPSVASTA